MDCFAPLAMTGTLPPGVNAVAKDVMTLPATFMIDTSRRRRARRGVAPCQMAGDAGAGGDVCAVHRGEGAAACASGLRLHRGVCRSRHDRRPRRLVRRGGAVQAAAGIADPAHRDHPEQPASHRRQARRIHRKEFPGSRTGRGEVARRSISAPSSPTGCATASAAAISPALRCACCPRRSRPRKPPA